MSISVMPRDWASLIAAHGHAVVLALLRRGLRLDEARELAQAAWLKVMEKDSATAFARLDLPGLVITQANFLFVDQTRAAARRPAVAVVAVDSSQSAEDAVISHEQVRMAQRIWSTCSPQAQRVFLLAYEEPTLSHAALADRLGLSVQRVRQVLCEVRAKLRVALE